MILAPTYPMLRDATLRTFLELAEDAGILRDFVKSEMRAELAGRRTVLFRSADKPDRLRGPNLGWFWMDEAAMSPHQVWLIMLGRLREAPGIGWATTTPRGKNWLYKTFVEGSETDPNYWYTRASSRSNIYLPGGFVDSLVNAYDNQFAEQEVEGEFLDDTLGLLLQEFWVDRLAEVLRPNRGGGPLWLSADLGEGTGRDSTAIFVGDALGIHHGEESNQVGIPEAALRIHELSRTWGVAEDRIVYDANGRGKDLRPYLEQYGITEAYPYKGSRSGGKEFENKRSRMGWLLRQRLDPERPRPVPALQYDPDRPRSMFDSEPAALKAAVQPPFSLPAEKPWWPKLEQELKALKYRHKGRKIALEDKKTMAQILGRSPDLVDALLMSFALGDDD